MKGYKSDLTCWPHTFFTQINSITQPLTPSWHYSLVIYYACFITAAWDQQHISSAALQSPLVLTSALSFWGVCFTPLLLCLFTCDDDDHHPQWPQAGIWASSHDVIRSPYRACANTCKYSIQRCEYWNEYLKPDLSGLGEPSGLFSKLVIGVTAWMAVWFNRMATA